MSQRRKIARRALRLVAVSKGGVADIYLEGPVGFPDEGGMTAAEFREQLARCKGATVINVHINSPGGVVTEGMNMYAVLRAHPARKVGIVEGLCASIASVVFMGCDDRRVAKGSFVMIHDPSIDGAGGGSADLRAVADNLDQIQSEMLDIYEARTGIDRKRLEKMVTDETYFTAEEAVEAGIADSVDGAFEAKIDMRAVARLDPKKVPAALRARAEEKEKKMKTKAQKIAELEAKLAAARAEEDGDEDEETETEDDEKPVDEDDDKPVDEDDDEKKEASAALVNTVLALTKTKSVTKALGKLVALVSVAAAGGHGARADQVTAAIKAGKLLPSLKSVALGWSEKTWSTYVNSIGGASVLKLGARHTPPKDPPRGERDTSVRAGRNGSPEDVVARSFRIPADKRTEVFTGALPESAVVKGEGE